MSRRTPSAAWTTAAAAIAAGMAFIDTTALTVALPALRTEFHASRSELLWIHNAYAVTLAALLLPGGSLGDRYGIRRTFIAGIICFGLSSITCGFATGAASLIALRSLQGLSAALMIPGSLAMIARATPGHSLGKAVGRWSAFTLVATALGPVMGGILVQNGFWRGVFLINVPLAAIAATITILRTSHDPPSRERQPIDWPGILLLIMVLASLSYALIDRSLPAAAGLIALPLLVMRERSARHPVLPPVLLRSRPLLCAVSISLLVYSAWAGFTYLLPTHLIEGLHFPPAKAGTLQIPTLAMLAITSPLAGRLLDRRGPRPVLGLGAGLCAIGFAMLLWPGIGQHPHSILIPLALLGIGLGFCAAPLSAIIISSAPPGHHGLAAGVNSTTARIASALGVALIGSLAYPQGKLVFPMVAGSAAILCLMALPLILAFPCGRKTD